MSPASLHRLKCLTEKYSGGSRREWISVERESLPACMIIVSAHRRILGMASVVCVLVKICVSSISLYKLDTDKLTAPFESAHQFTLVCTVSDAKTVPGCHYNLC